MKTTIMLSLLMVSQLLASAFYRGFIIPKKTITASFKLLAAGVVNLLIL